MSDRTVTLSFEVPEEVVREAQRWLTQRPAHYRAVVVGAPPDAVLCNYARAAALEVELPPERKPVTPETPWGTVIDHPGWGRRRFLAPVSESKFAYDYRDGGLALPSHGTFGDHWFEVDGL